MRIGEYAPGGIAGCDWALGKISAPSASRSSLSTAGETDSFQSEIEVLLTFSIGKPTLARAAQAARSNGTTIEQELLANGWIEADSYYVAIRMGSL